MTAHKTAAWPLSLIYGVLIIYASLYPFTDWRNQGPLPLGFLLAPWPQYWTGFDVVTNGLGYAPFGFLLTLAGLRTGRGRQAVMRATLGAGMLSLVMEATQSYLPARVPSNLDFVLNVVGAWMGALAALLLEKVGALDRWIRFRERWFVQDARGALVLLAVWPLALLFPASVPFGLGQVFERLESALADLLLDTPFLEWLPIRVVEFQPLTPVTEMASVMLGVLIPCLLGFCVIPATARRMIFLLGVLATGLGATVLSATMSYGPTHAWAWISQPVLAGLVLFVALALLLVRAPTGVCAAVLLLSLGLFLAIINQAPAGPYFAQTLQTWEQGQFIRFHGLAQWLGWIWPYAVLVYVIGRAWTQSAGGRA